MPTDDVLDVVGLAKSFDVDGQQLAAVDGVSFRVAAGDFYTLLGPSGCGKTTTLRCVAGLERPEQGSISLMGRPVAGPSGTVPAHQRQIGMVFQSYAIWPHMSVFDNVAFPLRVGKRPRVARSEIRRRVEEALAVVALDGLESRQATKLSGGQQQRLALARALVRQPALLLLDEPLSNLDAKLRDRMRGEVRSLQRRVGVTTVYVTHDQTEALSMSSQIAVMNEGRIVQEGTPRQVYQEPATSFVARFVGASNFIDGRVVANGHGGRLGTSLGSVALSVEGPLEATPGTAVTVAIRPANVFLTSPDRAVEHGENSYDGVVEQVTFLGDDVDVLVRVGDTVLEVRHHSSTTYRPGDSLVVQLPKEHCVVITDD